MQRDQFNQKHQKTDTLYRPTVVNAQCIIGEKKVQMGEHLVAMLSINIQKHIEKVFPVLDI